ncbi:MAG: penicillin-binding protein [Acidobacteriaceae bacterium]|nr:penicillin-binding protein [Acidobacteriaceae bacterium]MBV9763356.1 penicillin-binding protein [Acidobacteriaceae bacterium]
MNLHPRRGMTLLLAMVAMGAVLGAQPLAPQASATATSSKKHKKKHKKILVADRSTTRAGVIHTDTAMNVPLSRTRRHGRHRIFVNPWTEPTYADSTVGDNVDGEDLVVRKAAVDALGPYNGTVVVADSQTGRILSIVNQKLATKGAYQPCSTVKIVVSLASLSERIITPEEHLRITRRFSTDMTDAIARSNNLYFAKLGQELGFDRVERYGKLFGLGEKAGLDIPGEEAGYLADEPPTTGVGMMTSFGDGIRLTPLELTSIITTVSNGGTMYYLQYPRSQEEVEKFIPRIKRVLDISDLTKEIKPGMMAAVEYGTARRANYNPNEPIFGKTGTCTDTAQPGVHLGWFGSFNDTGKNKLAVVVLLTGGRGISGPIASGIAGNVYHNLDQQHYFGPEQQALFPAALVSLQNCCRR